MELQFKNVTKAYGDVHAVDHVTHSMEKGLFTGTAESGYKKYMQASKDSVDAVEKEISDSENLKSRAMESAKTQIDMLIRKLSIDDCDTVLYFL